MLEKIVFNLLAVSLFILIFAKLIKKNDTSYINILAVEFIGIAIKFAEIISKWNSNVLINIITYSFSVILPILVIVVEQKNINILEAIKILQAKILIMLKKDEEAKKVLLNIIEKYPKSYIAHRMLAEKYVQEGNISTAIEEYVRAVENNLKDYISYFKIAKLLKDLGRTEESETMLRDLLRKNPDYYEATETLGDIYYEQERFKEAISIYTEALRYNPGKYEIYYNLGMVYTRLNDFQRAKEYYAKAAEINSLLYNGIFNIGQISMIMGELEEAERYFQECLQGEDVEAFSYFYLAQIEMLRGNKDKALNYLNIALEIDCELYKKIEGQILFVPIMKQIKYLHNHNKRLSKLTKKEQITQKHLYDTFNLVGNMNNHDLKMIKNIENNEKSKEAKIEEKTLEQEL